LDVARESGQDDDSRFGKFVANPNHRIQAIHLGHLQVHQRNVRMVCAELLKSFAAMELPRSNSRPAE